MKINLEPEINPDTVPKDSEEAIPDTNGLLDIDGSTSSDPNPTAPSSTATPTPAAGASPKKRTKLKIIETNSAAPDPDPNKTKEAVEKSAAIDNSVEYSGSENNNSDQRAGVTPKSSFVKPKNAAEWDKIEAEIESGALSTTLCFCPAIEKP